ncbi:MAG: adenylate/guanylate cyclase domain-containing protein [Hyphomicrobiales bacterium]
MEQRKLAALLAADIVGYSRLTGLDEDRTLARLRALRSDLLDPTIAIHRGRVVKRTGDGLLVEFASIVDAVKCGLEIQTGMIDRNAGVPDDRKILFRIGIHLGDVVQELDGDLMGDGVNIAARLEGVAEPGGLCLSEDAYRQVRSRLDVAIHDLGEARLKNIADPVRLYSVRIGDAGAPPARTEPQPAAAAPAKAAQQASIVVLPFKNMSADPEQEFFADGLTEDIITALSRIGELFVISRNSSFVFKGQQTRIDAVARELGVRYVLEGSVRRAGSRVRVTAQLVDSTADKPIWAERYDEPVDDIFEVQDKITRSIAVAMQVKLSYGEFTRLWDGQTSDLRAWERLVTARNLFLKFTSAENAECRRLLKEALDIDPRYTGAMVQLGLAYWYEARANPAVDRTAYLAEAERLADHAIAIDPMMGAAFMVKGAVALLRDQHQEAVSLCKRANVLSPSDSWALAFTGMIQIFAGQPQEAVSHLKEAIRLSPYHPNWYVKNLSLAYIWAGNVDDALTIARQYTASEPNDPGGFANLALALDRAGDPVAAADVVSDLKDRFRDFTLRTVALSQPYGNPQTLETVLSVLQKAGLPP